MKQAYALITPAKNEDPYLPRLIQCVMAQTAQPAKWIIVDDNSDDATYNIALAASQTYAKLFVVRLTKGRERSFGSKAYAFRQGYELLRDTQFEYIGNLDADVTFGSQYYERILQKMVEHQNLGVASGIIYDKTPLGYRRTISNLNHAVGAVQFWRKDLFDEIGGYKPVTIGGVDSLAERTARMKGWETRSFEDLPVFHHKPLDTANAKTKFRIAYRAGLTDYYIGTHPLFSLLKAVRRIKEKPILISSLIRIIAYFKLWYKNTPRDASDDLVQYLKNEELEILKERLRHLAAIRAFPRVSQ